MGAHSVLVACPVSSARKGVLEDESQIPNVLELACPIACSLQRRVHVTECKTGCCLNPKIRLQ